MNKQELDEWIKGSRWFDSQGEYDDRGWYEGVKIYQRDGKLYQINVHGDRQEPSERWIPGKGYDRGVFEPIEVTHHVETITIDVYEPVKKEENKNELQ